MGIIKRDNKGRFLKGFISLRKIGADLNCLICNKSFHIKPSAIKSGEGKYCSMLCRNTAFKGQRRSKNTEFKKGSSVRLGIRHTEKSKQKMSIARKGKNIGEKSPSWKGGKPKCADCSKQLSAYSAKRCVQCHTKRFNYKKVGLNATKEYWKKIGLKGLLKQQNMKEPTSIEKKVYDFLILKGIIFEKQKLINGKFIVDVYIPSLNLVIEADGNYWHSLDRVMKKDKAENAYLKKCGFKMLRLSEDEINSGKFKERLVQ